MDVSTSSYGPDSFDPGEFGRCLIFRIQAGLHNPGQLQAKNYALALRKSSDYGSRLILGFNILLDGNPRR